MKMVMKNRKTFVMAFAVCCTVLNLYLIMNNVLLRSRCMKLYDAKPELRSMERALTDYVHSVSDLFSNCGIRLGDVSLTDIADHCTYDMDSLLCSLGDGDIALVCRFNHSDCEKCITYAVEKASEFAGRKDVTLFVFGRHDDDHMLSALKARYDLDVRTRWFNVPEMDIPIERHGNPYYMVITKTGQVMDVFTPDKMNPAMTDRYFGLIDAKWESNRSRWL